jgi:hypothetical protein
MGSISQSSTGPPSSFCLLPYLYNMKKIIMFLVGGIASLMLLVSCGKSVDISYDKLEAQYVELTPYWKIVIEERHLIKDQNAAIEFSKYYEESRHIINLYHTLTRDNNIDNITELLWNLRRNLNSASTRTNAIINGKSL